MDLLLQASLVALVFVVMMIGLFGLVLPIFPGLVVIWAAALGYGVVEGFNWVGWVILAFITLLMAAGSLVDNYLMGKKAREGGASWWALGVGWIGGIAGSLLLPPLGGIPGALLAIFLFEFLHSNNWSRAYQLTRGVAVGCGWAFVLRFLMGLMMIGLWIIWAYTQGNLKLN